MGGALRLVDSVIAARLWNEWNSMIDSRGLFLDDRAALVARALGVRAAAFDRLGAMVAVLDGSGLILDTNEAW